MKQIPLTQGKFALVDDEDYEYLMQWKWFAYFHRNTWYAARSIRVSKGKQSRMPMHRQITNAPDGILVDHKDRNGLNNQRHNLRHCSNSQNRRNSKLQSNNTSGYKGVTLDKTTNTYRVRIIIDGKRRSMGYYPTAIDAAHVYDLLAIKYYGEFSSLNFPQ